VSRSQFRRYLMPVSIVAVLVCIGASSAYAASAIEGVWSFNGGAVDIQAQAGGTFRGVVTASTKFAQCSHPVNEEVWTAISPQPDGSYFGLHQWYFEGTCAPNPTPGPTAWRVLRSPAGALFVRVCFSEPGGPQPTIAADGTSTHVTYGCTDSASIAPIPTVVAKQGTGGNKSGQISFGQIIGLPAAHQCLRRRTLTIALHNPAYDPLKEVVIKIGRHKLADVRNLKKLKKPIMLKNLPGGSFKLKVLAITVLDQHLSGSRTYHQCKRSRSHKIKLRQIERNRSHG
jgi:hypothetical protein